MRHSRPVHANVIVFAKVEEFLPHEMGAIVGDDRVGYAKAIDDVDLECYGLLGADIHDGSSLDPIEELVDRYEKMREALGRLSERPHHVEVPHNKRPCDGDGLKRLRREMSLSSKELAPLATTHDVF
jgi:hypothetical protein